MKDLGLLHYFLGLEIVHTTSSLFLCQEKYATALLKKAKMWDCKSCKTPCPASTRLHKNEGTPLDDPTEYRSLVGALQYPYI